MNKPINVCGLIHIQEIIRYQLFKALYTDRKFAGHMGSFLSGSVNTVYKVQVLLVYGYGIILRHMCPLHVGV